MNWKDMEGQLDFLGLITEYTDAQGATVRVREPGAKRSRPIPPPREIEQLSFDFDSNDKGPEVKEKTELKAEPKVKRKPKLKAEPETKIETELRVEPEKKNEPEKKIVPEKKIEPEIKVEEEVGQESGFELEENTASKELLFKQCKRCWCFDCRHNSRNEAVPRQMCGAMIPCPACDGCISEDMATICEIGNAKEGCMTRALEEGIYKEDI